MLSRVDKINQCSARVTVKKSGKYIVGMQLTDIWGKHAIANGFSDAGFLASLSSHIFIGGLILSLSGCVSAVSPASTLQSATTTQNSDTQESQLALDENGEQLATGDLAAVIPVPERNPLVVAAQNASVDSIQPDTQVALATNAPTPASTPSPAPANTTTNELSLVETPKVEAANSNAPVPAQGNASAVPAQKATQNLATHETRRPSLLARLFQRPKRNVGRRKISDDRQNTILRSSRTVSRSNAASQSIARKPSLSSLNAMPGVKSNEEIFGIKRGAKPAKGRVRMASVIGLSRFNPKSLKTQTSNVDVSCIRPEVIRFVKIIERHYGRPAIVTSGYRSPSRNRRAGGARNSMHIYCKAVDIQVKGVSKWDLAKYIRSIPGRGGVGTYCYTKSVHLDVGPRRDWHYSCRRKSKRRRKT